MSITTNQRPFTWPVRVYYEATDAQALVYYANYFRYMEAIEHAFFRSLGLSLRSGTEDGVAGAARIEAACSYRAPLCYEDVVELHLLVAEMRTRSITYQIVFRKVGEEIARGSMVVVFVGKTAPDGSMQPLRRGTVRVLLKSGVPIIPCGITGSYDVWPRWSRRPRRCPVHIKFGEPILFGAHHDRAAREAALPAATARIEAAIRRLIDVVDTKEPDPSRLPAVGPEGAESWA